MPTDLPKNITKLVIAFIKHQAEIVLGEDTIDIAGDILGVQKIYGEIDDLLTSSEGSQKILEAAQRADAYFRERCKDQDLRDAFTIPMGDLPSVQAIVRDLPESISQESALKTLREILSNSFPNLDEEQIEYGATLYLDCLDRALLPLKNFAMPIIGQAVLDSKSDIKEIKAKLNELALQTSSIPTQIAEIKPPLPEFSPPILDRLEVPGGALRLNDPFYIERKADETLKNEISVPGRTITICAARQTGKTSLLFRGMEYAREKGASTVYLNAQTIDHAHLRSIEKFLRNFAEYVVFELGLDTKKISQFWPAFLTPQQKLNNVLQNYVLMYVNNPVIIGMDEIDKLFDTDFYSDFFALVRSWHDNRARDKRWEKLTIAMIISTEPFLLISNYQSPFNVGKTLYLEDFDIEQVELLNRLHDSPMNQSDISSLMESIGGHPYLTRQALYTMVAEKLTWSDMEEVATDEFGPFGKHLLHYVSLLQNEHDLEEALRKIILKQPCPENLIYRLIRAGLVKKIRDISSLRCALYYKFFKLKYKL